jgi:DNA-binding XRE family transcriptional regulator
LNSSKNATPVKAEADRDHPSLSIMDIARSNLLENVAGDNADYRLRVIYAAAVDNRINSSALRHLIVRQMVSEQESGECHAYSQDYFAHLEGVSRRSIVTAEKQLDYAGYLSIYRRKQKASRVNIVSPTAVSQLIRSIREY